MFSGPEDVVIALKVLNKDLKSTIKETIDIFCEDQEIVDLELKKELIEKLETLTQKWFLNELVCIRIDTRNETATVVKVR